MKNENNECLAIESVKTRITPREGKLKKMFKKTILDKKKKD